MPHHFPPLNRFPLASMAALAMIPYPPFPSPNEGVGESFVDETGVTQIYTQEMHDEFLDKLDIWCHMSKEERTEYKTVKKEKEVGRNDPCPCGSGKKFKKCCLR